MQVESVAAVILAAGQSKRLGKEKQLVEFNQSNLLQHTIDCNVGLEGSKKYIILGHSAEKIKQQIDPKGFQILINPNYSTGMASSIQTALHEIEQQENIEAILFLVCDQPFLNRNHLEKLIEVHKTDQITASSYADTFGVPMIIPKKYWPLLHQLSGDQGAKALWKVLPEAELETLVVKKIAFPKGEIDIDTTKQLSLIK